MTEYRKYMFDDFIVEKQQEEVSPDEVVDEQISEEISTEEELKEENISESEEQEFEEREEETKEKETLEEEEVSPSYSQDELDAAVRQASEEAYRKGAEEVKQSLEIEQVKLLEEIERQLKNIFDQIESKAAEREAGALKVAMSAVEKIFPTLEKEQAEAEIKKFLNDNFVQFASQEMLSFSFHPDSISLIAESLGKLAEKNDFEGKIAVHKDETLGVSDCRVEWKSGGVERKVSAALEKIEDLTNNNEKERENGEQFES